jgi:predicted DNA binding protein
MHNFLVDSEAVRREELWSWNLGGDPPAVLFYVEGDIEPYRERLAGVDSVAEFDLTPVSEDSFYSFVRAGPSEDEREWMQAFYRESVVVVPPVVYTGGGETVFTVLGDPDHLRALVAELPERVDATVDRVGEFDRRQSRGAALTGRQREAVEAAVDLGYYDVPREATLDDVAAELGVASSTVSDHLRKAEAAVMGELV